MLSKPDPLTTRRLIVLLACLSVSLCSGTNYAVSSYSPQLARRLHLSSTQLNVFSASGNLGVYITGPLFGIIVDRKGPRLNLMAAAGLLLVGYGGIRGYFDGGLEYKGGGSLVALCLFAFCTGAGSSAGLSAAVNSGAKSFPDTTRATATGVILAGFGLSAFLFSTLSHTFFAEDTSSFLALLAIGCFVPCFLGIFLIYPVYPPLPTTLSYEQHQHHQPSQESNWQRPSSASSHNNYSLIPSSSPCDSPGEERENPTAPAAEVVITPASPSDYGSVDDNNSHQRTKLVGQLEREEHMDEEDLSLAKVLSRGSNASLTVEEVEITGKRLLRSLDFWLLTGILCCLSGTGLMYINNGPGLVAMALFSRDDPEYDVGKLAKIQAAQVSIISLWNCSGRILIGLGTDLAKHKLSIRRVHFLTLISFGFILAQLVALSTTDINDLWIVSSALGLSYGGLFGLAPVVCMEWFGLSSFSLNWGFVSMAPIVGGNLLNLAFGRIFDSHTAAKALQTIHSFVRRGGTFDPNDKSHECYDGSACYREAFVLTTWTCVLAFGLSVYAGWRREMQSRRAAAAASRGMA